MTTLATILAVTCGILTLAMVLPAPFVRGNTRGSVLHVYTQDLIHKGQSYMMRWVLCVFGWEFRLHHIRQPDRVRHLHDHPWTFWSLVLRGRYTHVVRIPGAFRRIVPRTRLRVPECVQTRAAGQVDRMGPELAHCITQVSEGGTWTFCVTRPRERTWGFWVDLEWVQRAQVKGMTVPPSFDPLMAPTEWWVSHVDYFRYGTMKDTGSNTRVLVGWRVTS